jgi:hypothetical protein
MIALIRKHVPEVGPCAVGGKCVYRRKDGKRCVAGAFLPDGHPALRMRKKTIAGVRRRWPDLDLPMDVRGMSDLQQTHDFAGSETTMHPLFIEWIGNNTQEPQ